MSCKCTKIILQLFGFLSTVGAFAQIWLLTCLTVERAWVVWSIQQARHHMVGWWGNGKPSSELLERILVSILYLGFDWQNVDRPCFSIELDRHKIISVSRFRVRISIFYEISPNQWILRISKYIFRLFRRIWTQLYLHRKWRLSTRWRGPWWST